jgi:hypothetical protein
VKYLTHALFFILGCLLTYCGTEHFKPIPEVREIEKEVIKEKIITKEKEVDLLKEEKKGITYKTTFKGLKPTKDSSSKEIICDTIKVDCDSLANEIYVELIKCDSIVKLDSAIIQAQDTIIIAQKELIADCEQDNTILKSDLKKQKRKNFFTKVAGVVVVAITVLLMR